MKAVPALFVLAAILAAPAPAIAQEAPALPAICTEGAMDHGIDHGMAMTPGDHAMSPGGHAMAADAAHADLMAGMDETNALMMQGMQAADIDVAFVCGMIPHHMAAITMARAELAHGDEPWAKSLAEAIIAAQEREIAEMIDWLNARQR
jgi:uncharacterized protein (DUF305 family)